MDIAVKLAEVEQRCKSNTHQITEIKETVSDIHELTTSVKLLAQNMERMAAEQEAQGARLAVLERKPAEQWNNMTRTIFTTVVSTLAGGLVGAIIAVFAV